MGQFRTVIFCVFTIFCLLVAAAFPSEQNRDVHISGKIIDAPGDTVRITVTGDKGDRQTFVKVRENHYSLYLRESDKYFVVTESQGQKKTLVVSCRNMSVENILVDCDFNSTKELYIMLEKPSDNQYHLLYQGDRVIKVDFLKRENGNY